MAAVSYQAELPMNPDSVRAEAAAQARALFANEGLWPLAEAFAFAHGLGGSYLASAPVLVACVPAPPPFPAGSRKTWRRNVRTLIAEKVWPLAERGAPLREVMAAFHIAYPLRRLCAYAMTTSSYDAVMALSRLDPRVLGNLIPDTPGRQRQWLIGLRRWRQRLQARSWGDPNVGFAWAAREFSLNKVGVEAVRDMADFVTSRDSGFSEAWCWARAKEEAGRWHARLRLDAVLRGLPVAADAVIDLAGHPDEAEVGGFTFVAIRTPEGLVEEGAAMRHCVGSYVRDVLDGRCHIVGVRAGERRVATLELRRGFHTEHGQAEPILAPAQPRVSLEALKASAPAGWRYGFVAAQLKGPCNAPVAAEVRAAAKAYARGLDA